MKFLLTIFLFVALLEAVELRSVRIGSFLTKEDAAAAYKELKEFINQTPKLQNLQQQDGFKFLYRRSGKYYITVAEPIHTKKTAYAVLGIIKQRYKDAYVRKIRKNELLKFLKKEAKKSLQKTTPQSIKKTAKKSIQPIEDSLKENIHETKKQLVEEKKNVKEQKDEIAVIPTLPQEDPLALPKEQKNLVIDTTLVEKVEKNASIKEEIAPKANAVKVKEVAQTPFEKQQHMHQPLKVEKPFIKEDKVFPQWMKIAFYLFLILIIMLLYFLYKTRKRVIELENNEMINKEKMNHILDNMKEKERWISYVSHELRNPMSAISGLTNLVLQTELEPTQREYLEKIERTSNYILNLLNDILDISKIREGKLSIQKVEFNINEIVNYAYNVVSLRAKYNNVAIITHIEKDVPSRVIGDPLRIGQVLINLLSNAVKFSKNSDVTLQIKKVDNFADKVTLAFSIADNGTGMTKEELKNLFNPYYQIETPQKEEGSGLGLYISKYLLDMMGGKIRVKSQKGVGTTFVFELTLGLRDAQNKRHYRLPSKKLLDKKILIIDSSNKTAIPLIRAFSYFNYTIDNIPSVEHAGKNFPQKRYDIVVLNLEHLTPVAIQKLKHMKKTQDCKLVIFDNLYNSISNEMLEALTIDGTLKPPVTIQSVLDLITDIYMPKRQKLPKEHRLKKKLSQYKGKKILVVEDNVLNHKIIAGLLKDTGIELSFAENGQKALELLEDGARIDLIIMDLTMPIKDGYETALEIRKEKKYNKIPIIALSASVSEETIEKVYHSGMQAHIAKPIDTDIFYKKLLEFFEVKNFIIATDYEDIVISEDSDVVFSVETALAQCNNDEKMLKEILRDFIKMYSYAAYDMRKYCENNELTKARMLVKDIKDVALNLGAYKLGEVTAKLQFAIEKNNGKDCQKYIQEFDSILKRFFVDAKKYLQSS